MKEIPTENYSQKWAEDTRQQLPLIGDEREALVTTLDWHRATFELQCAGVAPDRISEKVVPPSDLTLHGLLRHLTAVERWWFQIQFAQDDVPMLYYSDDDPDQDFESLDGDIDQAWAAWRVECARSREIVDGAESLDQTGIQKRDGAEFSLRRLLIKMIAEYARHLGHADLLRESIDGKTGY